MQLVFGEVLGRARMSQPHFPTPHRNIRFSLESGVCLSVRQVMARQTHLDLILESKYLPDE